MTIKPPSVGDSNVSYKRIHETVPLAEDRAKIVTQVNSILSGGGVQKLIIEVGRPIKIERLVKLDSEGPITEESAPPELDDVMSLVRNGEVRDFPQPVNKNPFSYLFQAFYILSIKRLKPKVLVVHSADELRKWLNLDSFFEITELYGIEVAVNAELPELTGVLLADTPPLDPAFSIRITMESNETDSGKSVAERDSGQRNGRASGEVGKPT